jgi:hypothetical protein
MMIVRMDQMISSQIRQIRGYSGGGLTDDVFLVIHSGMNGEGIWITMAYK